MPKHPWFAFYPGDFLSSNRVAMMTTEEIGAYILLLCHEWQDPRCSLPNDDIVLSTLAHFGKDLVRLKGCFRTIRGRLVNDRLYKEWKKTREKSQLARKSVSIRWQYERNTNVIRTQYSSQPQPQLQEDKEKKSERCIDFDSFWESYPNKVGKIEAKKAWMKAKDRPPIADILQAITKAKHSTKWTKDGGEYIPNPATWLNQGRWADEPMKGNSHGSIRIPPFPGPDDPIGRGRWRQAYGDPDNPCARS